MARIVGAIGTSHTPTIGYALDHKRRDDPVWAPIFDGYDPVRVWLEQKKPDVMVIIYNDHVTAFSFDHYSSFALGIGDSYQSADEGGGPRNVPPVPGHTALAHHIGFSVASEEFDLSYFQGRPLDHGCLSPLSMLRDRSDGTWPAPIVPIAVGVLQFPIPSAKRCFRLGEAVRRAVESYPEDLSVVIVGTGGLSHQVHGERAGFNNEAWDRQFLDLIVADPGYLCGLTHAQLAERGGLEGSEVIMWLIMRGALSACVKQVHSSYHLPSMTGIATLILEDMGPAPDPTWAEAHRTSMMQQVAGMEHLTGTYPFTLAVSARTYRINTYLNGLTRPEHRQRFLDNEESSFADADLNAAERDMLRRRDWIGLIRYGAIFFGLEKMAAVLGLSNAHVYSAMRGESLAEFHASRRSPGAVYSVGTVTAR